MEDFLSPDQRRYLGKVHFKHMNYDDTGLLKTDAWVSSTVRSLKADGSPECLAMALFLEAVYLVYHDAIAQRKVEKDEGTLDVNAFKVEQASLSSKLKMFAAKIMVAMPNDFQRVLDNLDLENIKVYNKGAQTEQIFSLDVLKIKVTNFPPIVALVPDVNSMIQEVKDVYEKKELQFRSIKSDISSVALLKYQLAKASLKVFGKLTDHFSETPAKVIDFYDLEILRDDVKAKEIIVPIEYALQGAQGQIIHADGVDFDFEDSLIGANEGPLPIDIYLTSILNNVISVISKRIQPGETITFAINTIGAIVQKHLMIAIGADPLVTDLCNFKITVIKKN